MMFRLCTYVVFVLLICFDIGHAQRKQGRNNVPHTREVKTGHSFDCPEEFGYYPHPTDCTQYYVCVFGGALLESCTGGLMYSHELQTCDWPRNVGCDGLGEVAVTASVHQSSSRVSQPEQRVRYTIVPTSVPPAPAPPSQQVTAVVSSRGQSRQLQHHAQEIIAKQQHQQQLYEDAEDNLPPAEENENDRQQRVYRGQPSTVGQVQRDRDGLRHTNAIPTSGRSEKIGVISFGTQHQQQQQSQQPLQQPYRYDTILLCINNSLTNDLTELRRPKRQIRQRQLSVELKPIGESNIQWQSRSPILYQITKKTAQQQNAIKLQPPPPLFLHKIPSQITNQQTEYSNIFSTGQTEFEPFTPNYNQFKPKILIHQTRAEILHQPTNIYKLYDYNNDKPNERRNPYLQGSGFPENYSYSNFGIPKNMQYFENFQPIINIPNRSITDINKQELSENESYQKSETGLPSNRDVPNEINKQINNNNNNNNNNRARVKHEEYNKKANDVSKEQYENPFANPNFDFDKFISQLRTSDDTYNRIKLQKNENNFQINDFQNDSKEKFIYHKLNINNVRTPVTFSPPQSQQQDYYDDEYEDEVEEKSKNIEYKSPLENINPVLPKIQINHSSVKLNNSIPSKNSNNSTLIEDEDYEYYDDYDYTIPENKKHQNDSRMAHGNSTKLQPINNHRSVIKNISQTNGEKMKQQQNYLSTAVSQMTKSTRGPNRTRLSTITTTIATPTTTSRQNRDSHIIRNNHTKNRNRVEDSGLITQAPPSGRTLYNGSQHYDPAQYDPYYSLYEDDVELYRDSDYTQQQQQPQQQYTSNRAQQSSVQHTYRGTPAPITLPIHSTVEEEPTPQRGNAAYVSSYSTQPQDVYQNSASEDYQEDNYNNPVDDQTNYRQSSQTARQQIRGDRNEFSYFVETSPKSVKTTTAPRSIPILVQKQSVVPARSLINATTNQTRPQSIIISLSATPGQKSLVTQIPINFTATTTVPITSNPSTTNNVSDSKPPVQLVSLSTGFSLRHKDNEQPNTTFVTYKPNVTPTVSTGNINPIEPIKRIVRINRPAPFTLLSKLPNAEKKSVVFQLSSQLSHLTLNDSELLSPHATENPNKREIINNQKNVLQLLSTNTDSSYIAPTTYAPPKAFLAYILPKPSIANHTNVESIDENFYPKQRINSATENFVTQRIRYEDDKLIKTVIKKHPIKADEDRTDILKNNRDRNGRKIISKIHFGLGQSYTTSDKINNFVTTPISFVRTPIEPKVQESVRYLTTLNYDSTTLRPHIGFSFNENPILTIENATYLDSLSTLKSSDDINESASSEKSQVQYKNVISTSSSIEQLHIPDESTEKYYFEHDSEHSNRNDDQLRSQLFENRNVKPFRATAELPTVSEILANRDDETDKKEVDSLPTYKPKAFQLPNREHDRERDREDTSVTDKTLVTDASRNFTIPLRTSRVNTAIKSLIAFGVTRRNSHSTPNCNENQTTPDTKCNEIQKQRTGTRGRGSSHYSNVGDSITVNRGTPAARLRPTLKPSTSIVSKASEYIDIYRYPPHRPATIYPQPQVDKTAAKCRKDVCLLPDCNCGGRDIPGDISVEEVPQMVLLTFDDAVNDLNKQIYSELFENDRKNPNGCPITATFYVSHEWTDYGQVQSLYADGHELASHTISHSFGEQFSQKKWNREVSGQREILSAYGGVHLEDVRGMRAPFLSVGGNKMFKMLYDSNFTYDSSLPVYENRPPSWPYTLDYKLFHDCMIPPCPTRSYPGVWEVPMVMWQDLNGGRCSMGDACSNPPEVEGVYKMLLKNFDRHYTTNRAPFGLFYHAAWFTQPHHKEAFIKFLDFMVSKDDVYLVTNWQAIQWVRDPTPLSRIRSFQPFQCNFSDRPKRCNNPKVCNLWHKSGVRYMKTCQPCPDIYPWTGKTGIRSSRIDNDIED